MPPLYNPLGLAPGRRVRLFDAYIEAREQAANGELDAEEAMSTSDFPTYIGKFLRHTFLERFNEIVGSWPQYTKDFSLEDFEEYTSSRFGRFADIPEKTLNGPYDELAVKEFDAEKLKLREFGAAFSITRQLIISDRLGKIAELPNQFAEAMARTISKRAAVTAFQSNPTMYDGDALFSANHSNTGTTALVATTAGMNALIAAEQALDAQTDDEGFKIQTPGQRTLIIPVELRWVVNALVNNQLIPNGSSVLEANLVAGRYNVIEEPFFTDATNWYMASDLKGPLGFLAAVTLNGNTTPFLGLKDPGVRGVLGGDDPYSFEFDEISYKIRHDFEFKPVEWRGIYGSIVA